MNASVDKLSALTIFDLFDVAADAMLFVNHQGKIVRANESAQQMFNYAENEITGLTVEALIPESLRQQHQQNRTNYVSQPQKRSMGKGKNLSALTKDGRELPVDIGLTPINAKEEKFVLVTFHSTDKQILAETSLKESQARLQLAKQAAGLGVFDITLSEDIVYCDEHTRDVLGFDENKPIMYQHFIQRLDTNSQDVWQLTLKQASESNENNEFRVELLLKNHQDGMQQWILVAGKIYTSDEENERVIGVLQDITEQKTLLKKLNTQRIDMEMLAKQQIAVHTASAIAHEINQPLTAISAYSEVALQALKTENIDWDRLNRSLTGSAAQAQRAGKSLHELMEFLHSGEVIRAAIDINEVINEAINITHESGYGGFRVNLDLEPNLPKVKANQKQLQKVMINLLRNGVEAANDAGIAIADLSVKVQTHAEASMAEVIVQDNGPGLSQEVAARIFEPFFTTKPHGIGMGLVITRSLVEANGGQLWLDTDSKEGATFHLTLPFYRD